MLALTAVLTGDGNHEGGGMPTRKTIEDILKDNVAREAWEKLKAKIPEPDMKRIVYCLEAVANRKQLFRWMLPTPRQARRFANRLPPIAQTIKRMSLYYGSELPLGDPAIKNLPDTLTRYAQLLESAARNRKKMVPPDDLSEWVIEILDLLNRSELGENRHYFEQAAHLLRAAYVLAKLNRSVDADQLRKLYDRQSLQYRLKHGFLSQTVKK
jgi:hypothetical protein